MIVLYMIKESCLVKLIQKAEKNSDWPDINHPPPIHFLKHVQQQKTTQKTKENIKLKKNNNPS